MSSLHSIRQDLERARRFPIRRIETQRPGRLIIEYDQGTISFIHVCNYGVLMQWLSSMAWLLAKAPIIRIEQ